MTAPAPSLLEVQRALLACVAGDGCGAPLSQMIDDVDPAACLAIYRNTSLSTLTTALSLTYPAVRKLVGEKFFEGAARVFIREQRATSAWLDEYGRQFGAFLATFSPACSLPYLPNVAELEWSVSRALHAPEAPGIDLDRMARLSPSESERLCLVAHPALSLIRGDFPADTIWHVVLQDEAGLGSIQLEQGPVFLLIERHDSNVRVQRLSEPAWRFTAALCAGTPLAAALQQHSDAAADLLIGEHLAAGRFIDFELCQNSNASH